MGDGCNNAKPPWPPHRNTMINVVGLGCGPIRTGEGAAAPFIGVHILGKIQPAGGFGRNSAGGGVCYPGRIAMGGSNWTIYPGPKTQPYHNQPLGAS